MSYWAKPRYLELNEYGIVYNRETLKETLDNSNEQEEYFDYLEFVRPISNLIRYARPFYEKCEYLGNIKVTAQLQPVYMKKIGGSRADISVKRRQCLDSQVSASTQCLAQDLMEGKEIDVVDKLVEQLFWAFNFHDSTQRRELLKRFYSNG